MSESRPFDYYDSKHRHGNLSGLRRTRLTNITINDPCTKL